MQNNGIENLRIENEKAPTLSGRELIHLLAAPQGQQIPGSRSALFTSRVLNPLFLFS
jgi:hypothetical protein